MKKVILIIIPLLLIGGGATVFFLAKSGKLQIPGITPKKVAKAKPAAPKIKVVEEEKPTPPPVAKEEPPKPKPTHRIDEALGAKKLAKLWNELAPATLLGITKTWKAEELARVVSAMKPDKAAALLGQMDPKQLEAVSREIKRQGSLVPL